MEQQINPRELEAFLKAKAAEAANNAVSQSDGVTIQMNQGNVPGAYITADQKLQDSYSQQVALNNVAGLYGQQGNPGYFGPNQTANMNYAPVPIQNPNYTVEPQRNVTADVNGNIIVY